MVLFAKVRASSSGVKVCQRRDDAVPRGPWLQPAALPHFMVVVSSVSGLRNPSDEFVHRMSLFRDGTVLKILTCEWVFFRAFEAIGTASHPASQQSVHPVRSPPGALKPA